MKFSSSTLWQPVPPYCPYGQSAEVVAAVAEVVESPPEGPLTPVADSFKTVVEAAR